MCRERHRILTITVRDTRSVALMRLAAQHGSARTALLLVRDEADFSPKIRRGAQLKHPTEMVMFRPTWNELMSGHTFRR